MFTCLQDLFTLYKILSLFLTIKLVFFRLLFLKLSQIYEIFLKIILKYNLIFTTFWIKIFFFYFQDLCPVVLEWIRMERRAPVPDGVKWIPTLKWIPTRRWIPILRWIPTLIPLILFNNPSTLVNIRYTGKFTISYKKTLPLNSFFSNLCNMMLCNFYISNFDYFLTSGCNDIRIRNLEFGALDLSCYVLF